jgi:hypothetical protein
MDGARSASARLPADRPRRDEPSDLAELTLAEFEALFDQRQLPRFHARQVFRWVWKHGVTDFAAMTTLGLALREQLAGDFRVSTPAIVRQDVSEDGTRKFVLALQDGRQIESVFIPDTPAQTFCISTQVGCAMGCAFSALESSLDSNHSRQPIADGRRRSVVVDARRIGVLWIPNRNAERKVLGSSLRTASVDGFIRCPQAKRSSRGIEAPFGNWNTRRRASITAIARALEGL